MNAGYDTDGLPEGSLVGISTTTGDSEGGYIYVKGETAYEFFYDLATTEGIKGEQGEQGPQGPVGPSKQGVAVPDVSGSEAADAITTLNALLASLRAAGLIANG